MRVILCAAALMIGCGPTSPGGDDQGTSGLPGEKLLSELTPDQASDLCYELADRYPERLVTCSSGETFSAGYQPNECVIEDPAPPTCTATVGDLRACAGAFYNSSDSELCAMTQLPPQCDPLLDNCGEFVRGRAMPLSRDPRRAP